MHALLDHFEASHVVVIGADGRPVYPTPPSPPSSSATVPESSTAAHSPYDRYHPHLVGHTSSSRAPVASIVIDYPKAGAYDASYSPIPSFPHSFLSVDIDMDMDNKNGYPDIADVYDPFGFAAAATLSSPAEQAAHHQPTCLPPALLSSDAHEPYILPAPTLSPPSASSHYRASPGTLKKRLLGATAAARKMSVRRRGHPPPLKKQEYVPPSLSLEHEPTPETEKNDAREPQTEREREREREESREKTYVCPNPLCSKRYLNPNGLKYHVEKGRCTAGVRGWAPVVAAPAPLFPSAPVPSVSALAPLPAASTSLGAEVKV